DREREARLAGVADDPRDVVGARALRDQRWAPVDHPVVHRARLVVAGVAWLDQRAAELRQRISRGRGDAHVDLLVGPCRGELSPRMRVAPTTVMTRPDRHLFPALPSPGGSGIVSPDQPSEKKGDARTS